MAILSKACKPDHFESRNSLELSFTNIQGLHSNFVDCESFLESTSPDIFSLCETNLDGSIDSGNFFMRGFLPLWSNGLLVKALDPQSRGPVFKTTGWLQGQLSLSSFRGR